MACCCCCCAKQRRRSRRRRTGLRDEDEFLQLLDEGRENQSKESRSNRKKNSKPNNKYQNEIHTSNESNPLLSNIQQKTFAAASSSSTTNPAQRHYEKLANDMGAKYQIERM